MECPAVTVADEQSSGLLAIPVLAGSGSVGMAGLLASNGLRVRPQGPVFYGLVALGAVGGTALSLLHVNPIKLLVFVAVIKGMAAAPSAAPAELG
jgi:hypothetical protein